MQQLMAMKQGYIGKAFIKYADPIDLSKYSNGKSRADFEKLCMELTEDLYRIQIQEQPIT